MAKTKNRGVTGKSVSRNVTTGRYTSGSLVRGTRVKPASDTDLVGSVRLTTPQQVARFGKLKQRIDAEMQSRGMRDSA